jgi:hypothetical protein
MDPDCEGRLLLRRLFASAGEVGVAHIRRVGDWVDDPQGEFVPGVDCPLVGEYSPSPSGFDCDVVRDRFFRGATFFPLNFSAASVNIGCRIVSLASERNRHLCFTYSQN